jgi:hypothetical protein
MKRSIIVALLLAASRIAACDQRVGAVQNGNITPPQYKKCMLSRGWRYRRTDR